MSKVAKELAEMEQTIECAPENKKGFLAWIKEHKKQLILAGISITTIVGIILSIKNGDTLLELWTLLSERVKKVHEAPALSAHVLQISVLELEAAASKRSYTPPSEAFDVNGHIRTMVAGRHHSAEKAAEAVALGIKLLPNQTLVSPYTKCAA